MSRRPATNEQSGKRSREGQRTHLFGGSAGREGTAVQIGGAISERFCTWFKLNADDRRLMLTAQTPPMDIEVWETGTNPQPSPKWHDWRPAWQAKMERLKKEGDTEPRTRYID